MTGGTCEGSWKMVHMKHTLKLSKKGGSKRLMFRRSLEEYRRFPLHLSWSVSRSANRDALPLRLASRVFESTTYFLPLATGGINASRLKYDGPHL